MLFLHQNPNVMFLRYYCISCMSGERPKVVKQVLLAVLKKIKMIEILFGALVHWNENNALLF